jgi:hypothetical protein
MLTDMRDVLPQIYEYVQANAELIEAAGGSATVAELDWLEPDDEVSRGSLYALKRFALTGPVQSVIVHSIGQHALWTLCQQKPWGCDCTLLLDAG